MTNRSLLDQINLLKGVAAFSILIERTLHIQSGHFGVDLLLMISGVNNSYAKSGFVLGVALYIGLYIRKTLSKVLFATKQKMTGRIVGGIQFQQDSLQSERPISDVFGCALLH